MKSRYIKMKSLDHYTSDHAGNLIRQDDFMLAFAVMFQFVVLMLQLLLIHLFQLESSAQEILGIFSKLVASLPILYVLPIILRKNALICFLTYLVGGLAFLTSFLFHHETFDALRSLAFNMFGICLPCFICVTTIQDVGYFIKAMHYVSVLIFSFGCLYIGLVLLGYILSSEYSMAFSYYLLIPACYFLYHFVSGKRKSALLISILSFLFMVLLGSRGAVVAYLIFAVFALCFHMKWSLKAVIGFLMIGTALIFFYIYSAAIIDLLNDFLSKMGMSSRTLMLLREGTLLSHDSGRGRIYVETLADISERPWMGYGIGGDRVLRHGSYVHNFFLEILLDYGILFGCIILMGLSVYIGVAYKRADHPLFFLMWFCIIMIPLLVSGSYLTETNFWIFMGLCFLFNKEKARRLRKGGSCYEKKGINHFRTFSAD